MLEKLIAGNPTGEKKSGNRRSRAHFIIHSLFFFSARFDFRVNFMCKSTFSVAYQNGMSTAYNITQPAITHKYIMYTVQKEPIYLIRATGTFEFFKRDDANNKGRN